MTEREFLDIQTRRIRARIRRDSAALHDQCERAIGPAVRRHPRISLAAGATAGLLVGRVLASARPGSPGIVSGAGGFLKGVGLYALRAKIADALLELTGSARGPAVAHDGAATTPE